MQDKKKAMGAYVNVSISLALKSNSVHISERGSKSVYRVECQLLASKQLVSKAKQSRFKTVPDEHGCIADENVIQVAT